jgi:hypothetical protein
MGGADSYGRRTHLTGTDRAYSQTIPKEIHVLSCRWEFQARRQKIRRSEMIYSISIFKGRYLIHQELFGDSQNADCTDSNKLLAGMTSAICGILSLLSSDGSQSKFEGFTTPEYRLDYFEASSGYTFIVVSDKNSTASRHDVRVEFERLYKLLFVPLVIRNPLFNPDSITGNLRDSQCSVFIGELRQHFRILKGNQVQVKDESVRPPVI